MEENKIQIRGKGSRPHIREMRRKVLMEIIMGNPTEKWTARRMAEIARSHPWFREHMPNYGSMTAYRDFAAIKEGTKKARQDLAEQYITSQLDKLDDGIEDIEEDLRALGTLDDALEDLAQQSAADPEMVVDTLGQITKFVKAKESLYRTQLAMMRRQGQLLPLEVAKEVNVQQAVFNIDKYHELREQLREENKLELDDGIIEGDFEG
jgi:prefoldin subunit 5